ncbi:MAG: DNA recombination protein RmuC [Oligosphaeraceae bacterium]
MTPLVVLAVSLALLLGLAAGFLAGRAGCIPRREWEREREDLAREEQGRRDVFSALSAQQLQSQSQEFRQRQREDLAGLLEPYRVRLEGLVQELRGYQKGNVVERSALQGRMEELVRQAATIGGEARRLTTILSQGTKSQGLFGEQALASLLRASELQENIHFFLQRAVRDSQGKLALDEEGSRRIPDCVVVLPDGGARLVVDSKCSASAYLRWRDAEDGAARETARREFLKAMRSHIDDLGKKDYATHLRQSQDCPVVDCVVMFVPLEAMLQAALAEQPDLLEYAAARKVLLTGPLNLMVCLRVVGLAWGSVRLEKNIDQIYDSTGQLLQCVGNFQKCFAEVRQSLEKARESWDNAQKALAGESGRGRRKSLLQCAEEIRRLRQGGEEELHTGESS